VITTTVRQIHGEEVYDIIHWLASYAFYSSPPLADKEKRREIIQQRKGVIYFALFEDGAPVACAASTPMTQQVRGALFGMGGVFDVVTLPAARRKGYSKQVLTRLFAAIREDERPLSSLYPFRESFYERIGFVTFPQYRKVHLAPTALLPLLERDLGGQVELTLIGDGYDAYLDYVHKLQRRVHGMAIFDERDEGLIKRNNYWLALARVDGEVVGLMQYNLRGEMVAEFKLRAVRFYYHTSQGRYLLLAWIARHLDQANQVEIYLPPFEWPETWLPDLDVVPQPIFRAPMGRVLDVAQISRMKTGPGCFGANVTDPLCPWNEGAFQFETVDGVLQVSPTDEVDCDLSIHAVSALVYGTLDPEDFALRGWGNPSPETQAVMREMFPPMQPYLHEHF
jgi:GNAT superfamily N-acetyltransferase